MPAGRVISAFLLIFLCAQGSGLAALEPLAPYPTPPGQDPGTQGAADTAYYLSTAAVEQEMMAQRRRGDGGLGLGEPEPCPTGAGHVPQWGRFEVAIVHPRSYENPFEDVTLNVTYTRPDSSTMAYWGFYDGDDTWRLRALADQAGTWRYQARFSDGTRQIDGTFTCIESDLPGLISAYEDNPIWFARKGDEPVLVRSLLVSDRFLVDEEAVAEDEPRPPLRRAAFLDWAQSQGYNMLSMAAPIAARRSQASGVPRLWDAERQQPNLAEYRRLESILDDLAKRGIALCPACGLFGRDFGFPLDAEQQERCVRYTLARLGSYPNIVWVVDGTDPDRNLAETEQLARKIKAMDPFGHLLCVSNLAGNDAFKDADWTSCGVLLGPRTANLRRLSRVLARNHSPSKPLYVQQTLWLGSRRLGDYSADEVRKNAYVLMMSGATANAADLGGNLSSGLSGTLDVSQKVQARHDTIKAVWDFFDGVPFGPMRPRQDLVDNGYCLAEPGRAYLVYLDEPGAVSVAVAGGMYRVKWINARDTSDVQEAGIIEGQRRLMSPQSEDDWLLSLTRVDIVAGEIRPH